MVQNPNLFYLPLSVTIHLQSQVLNALPQKYFLLYILSLSILPGAYTFLIDIFDGLFQILIRKLIQFFGFEIRR